MQTVLALDSSTGVWLSPIIVALIGGPLMLLIKILDRHNTRQHSQNMDVLQSIKSSVEEVKNEVKEVKDDVKQLDARLQHHIDWHMSQVVKEKV